MTINWLRGITWTCILLIDAMAFMAIYSFVSWMKG